MTITLPPFEAFPKIPRLHREIVVTEKIDGTNACIYIGDDFETIAAGSRSRWITPKEDNFGFARWVEERKAELLKELGPGLHYGEWWGAGIGRRYGLKEKRFSLFNVHRWADDAVRPACCHVVPEVYRFTPTCPAELAAGFLYSIEYLRIHGSMAAPGFMQPEGIVCFHTASQSLFKVTLEGDAAPKGGGG